MRIPRLKTTYGRIRFYKKASPTANSEPAVLYHYAPDTYTHGTYTLAQAL